MKYLGLLFFFFTIMGIYLLPSPSHTALAIKKENNVPPIIINTYHEDITGDGIIETIELKGLLLSNNTDFYHHIWVDISNEQHGNWRINYGGGYAPELYVVDFNLNHKNNILFRSESNRTSKGNIYKLHSINHNKVVELQLPKPNKITGSFKDDFEAEIKTSPYNKPIPFTIKDHKVKYVKQGIFNHRGQLIKNEQIRAMNLSISKPFLISRSKGYGLKSYQQLTSTNSLPIRTLETIWYYEKDKWIILQESIM